jgi:putative membrane protein
MLIDRPLPHHQFGTGIAIAMPDVLPSTRKLTLGELNLNLIANILVALVAALHAYFLILEMFLWDKPQGLKVFRNTPRRPRSRR